jgi:hypothetical protein
VIKRNSVANRRKWPIYLGEISLCWTKETIDLNHENDRKYQEAVMVSQERHIKRRRGVVIVKSLTFGA